MTPDEMIHFVIETMRGLGQDINNTEHVKLVLGYCMDYGFSKGNVLKATLRLR